MLLSHPICIEVELSVCDEGYLRQIVFLLIEVANIYERIHSKYLRSWAVKECLTQIKADDSFTHCISIGPVSHLCVCVRVCRTKFVGIHKAMVARTQLCYIHFV